MDRGADVVTKAGDRQFSRAGTAADLIGCFINLDVVPFSSERHGSRQTIRPRPDDRDFALVHQTITLLSVDRRRAATKLINLEIIIAMKRPQSKNPAIW
jgi:hypothetical protein